ncbi:GntR family transcriptional regulator [Mycobacterium sp. NPDC003449]
MSLTDSPSGGALPALGRATSQADLVAASLREAILAGRIRADDVLVERRIAEQLGVSKTPVREAFIQLDNSGLITTTRNRGVRVRDMTRTDARHVYEQRVLLEPWAVGTVARREVPVPDAVSAHRRATELLQAGEWSAMAMENRKFHWALYRHCHNPLVVSTLDALQDLTALAVLQIFWEMSPTAAAEHEEHGAILRAVTAGDAEGAERLLREHINASIDRVRASDDDPTVV